MVFGSGTPRAGALIDWIGGRVNCVLNGLKSRASFVTTEVCGIDRIVLIVLQAMKQRRRQAFQIIYDAYSTSN